MPNVTRWDVYDAADHLEDYQGLFYRAFEMEDWHMVLHLADEVEEWVQKLWAMSVISGKVGPAPFYERTDE